jgi:hypothetical protein
VDSVDSVDFGFSVPETDDPDVEGFMLIECSRALYRDIGSITDVPTNSYAPRFCWIATSFYDENDNTCMLLANKETWFCVIVKYEFDYKGFNNEVLFTAMREAFLVQGYDTDQIEAYLSEAKDVRFVSGAEKTAMNRLSRWLKEIMDSEGPLSEVASIFSRKKVQIDGKRIVPAEAMKESLVVEGKEVFKTMHEVLNLKIVLSLTPRFKVYRSFEVPLSTTFEKLHEIIQIAFDWENIHLHVFKVGAYKVGPISDEKSRLTSYFMEEEENLDEDKLTLENLGRFSKKFTYIYDYGDYWEHVIHIGKRVLRDGEPEVICTDGEGVSAWEDCGGAYGYEHMVHVLEDPENPEYENILEWTSDTFSRKFFKEGINAMLKGILKSPKRARWF